MNTFINLLPMCYPPNIFLVNSIVLLFAHLSYQKLLNILLACQTVERITEQLLFLPSKSEQFIE